MAYCSGACQSRLVSLGSIGHSGESSRVCARNQREPGVRHVAEVQVVSVQSLLAVLICCRFLLLLRPIVACIRAPIPLLLRTSAEGVTSAQDAVAVVVGNSQQFNEVIRRGVKRWYDAMFDSLVPSCLLIDLP